MGLHYNSRTSTNGLVLHYDAGNPKSYSGAGATTWYDLSGNGYHASISNSPAFSTDYGGCINFDNVDDFVSIPAALNLNTLGSTRSFTVMFGVYKKFYGNGGNNFGDSYILYGASDGYTTGWRISETNGGTPGNAYSAPHVFQFGNPAISSAAYAQDTINRFAVCAFTQNGTTVNSFINGIVGGATFGSYFSGTSGGTIAQAGQGVGKFAGLMSFIQIYNRALPSNEITQNYNAIKGRFGL
jgi:hypothetical protein